MLTTQTTLTLFKSKSPIMGYVFRSGKTIHFVGGLYATAVKAEIDELTETCQDSPTFYIDSAQKEISEEEMNPISVLKARLRKEWEAEQRTAYANPERDMGTTEDTGKLGNITTSATLMGAHVASGSAQAGTVVSTAKIELAKSSPVAPLTI